MITLKNLTEWETIRNKMVATQTIGFVPTMGCLHRGHASLLEKSITENDITVLSIFVNPTQFNDPSDYQNYPVTLDADLELAKQYHVDYVLIPDQTTIYPQENLIYLTSEHPLSHILEGKFRPGHFNGVCTVVMKLLNLVRATRAYFGEKDYQQYLLIKQMVADYFLSTTIIPCPTIREPSQLPYSSRNSRLSSEEKKLAEQFAALFHRCDQSTIDATKKALINLGFQVDYLEPYEDRLFAAVKIGQIRLIDNFALAGGCD